MLLDQIIDILVQALQGVILAVITFACVKWVIPYIRKITQNEIVKQAVQAAEKIYQDSGMGEKKREYKCICKRYRKETYFRKWRDARIFSKYRL